MNYPITMHPNQDHTKCINSFSHTTSIEKLGTLTNNAEVYGITISIRILSSERVFREDVIIYQHNGENIDYNLQYGISLAWTRILDRVIHDYEKQVLGMFSCG